MKNKTMYKALGVMLCCALTVMVPINEAVADGTEMLGMPSIDIAEGSQVTVAGVGLNEGQPGEIAIEIPSGVAINQVLLYWTGRSVDPNDHTATDTIVVNSTNLTGNLIGGPTPGLPDDRSSVTYRADITDISSNLSWVLAGQINLISVSGLDFDYQNDGAAIVVIFDDGTAADIMIMDGNDFAYYRWGYETVPIEFSIAPSADPQVGYMWLILSDIALPRPAAVDVTIGGATTRIDVTDDSLGNFLNVIEIEVPVPPGATNVIVQAISIPSTNPESASLAWSFASWELAIPHRECGGGGLTPGFWQNKHGLGLIDEYGALADLNELYLREDNGDHAAFATLKEFRSWIKARRAKNMAFQLSGHLAAMYMNVRVGSANGDALVYIGHEGDTISINNLLNAANEALREDGKTFSGDENRDYQEMLKNALDKANNNQNWVYLCTSHD